MGEIQSIVRCSCTSRCLISLLRENVDVFLFFSASLLTQVEKENQLPSRRMSLRMNRVMKEKQRTNLRSAKHVVFVFRPMTNDDVRLLSKMWTSFSSSS